MCACMGVCAETHRRTHTHTQRGHLPCAHQATLAGHHRGRLGHTPDCQPRLPRPRIHPEAGSAAGPQGRAGPTGCGPGRVRRSPACHGPPPRPALLPQGRKMADRRTHHFELRDRPTQRPLLAVHKGICKTRREPKVRRTVGTTPRGHLPPRTLRTVRVRTAPPTPSLHSVPKT